MFGYLNRGTAPGFAHYSLTVPAGTVCWGYSFSPDVGEALWDPFLDGDPPSYAEIREVRREESSSPAISYESREVGRGAAAPRLTQNGYWEANVAVEVELSDGEAERVARRLAETDAARATRRAAAPWFQAQIDAWSTSEDPRQRAMADTARRELIELLD